MNKRKNIAVIIIIILIISVAACSVAYINSFQIALKKAGLNTVDIHIIEECEMDFNGKEFQVIQTYLDDKIAMAIMAKNSLGVWNVSNLDVEEPKKSKVVSVGWTQDGGLRRFIDTEDVNFGKEWHFAYCGDNAIQKVDLQKGQIPENVTVNIQQAGNLYWIHVISFADSDVINDFNAKLIGMLEENGCIEK